MILILFSFYTDKSMVAYFCHHLSDNYVDLSDLYVVLSDLYVHLSDLYVHLSHSFVRKKILKNVFLPSKYHKDNKKISDNST